MMLVDVGPEDLKFISEEEMKIKYLSSTTNIPKFPVKGITYGEDTYRVFVNLIVARGSFKINVPFLVNSGCPDVYLSSEALQKLGCNDIIPNFIRVNIHGFKSIGAKVSPKASHFSNICVLGQNFFAKHRLTKFENTADGYIIIDHAESNK